MNHTVFGLDLSTDSEKVDELRQHRITLEDTFPDNHIDEPGLIFQRHKHNAAGCPRPLAADHQTCVTNFAAVPHSGNGTRIR